MLMNKISTPLKTPLFILIIMISATIFTWLPSIIYNIVVAGSDNSESIGALGTLIGVYLFIPLLLGLACVVFSVITLVMAIQKWNIISVAYRVLVIGLAVLSFAIAITPVAGYLMNARNLDDKAVQKTLDSFSDYEDVRSALFNCEIESVYTLEYAELPGGYYIGASTRWDFDTQGTRYGMDTDQNGNPIRYTLPISFIDELKSDVDTANLTCMPETRFSDTSNAKE